ncbi:MAG TPA: polyprenyl diphosphate synthase [Solirubrobacteraceae bacterium]|jgi:undecaprenyl diphosphate synthase|nr:polyprenyl diphosphate synthase [Solirubrobacteraceae bacterium]
MTTMPYRPRNSQPPARHVALIADGNRRWARARGLPVSAGYEAGADTLKARLADAIELGIEELSVYSFSTENWSRPAEEIRELISTLAARIEQETPELHANGVRVRFIGRRDDALAELGGLMGWAESLTKDNRLITLCIAFDYGGRAEILDAAKRFQGGTEEDFRRCLYAPDLHDPDLIVRTGGEQRLSNYLLWQAAYSELVFREEMWPDFSRAAFAESLARFSTRARRFGGRAADAPPTEATGGAHQLALRRVRTAVDDRSIR